MHAHLGPPTAIALFVQPADAAECPPEPLTMATPEPPEGARKPRTAPRYQSHQTSTAA